MTAATTARPRIAVLGGGIGGLAAAGFLHREGLACTVYEQASRLTEVGAGIVLGPNAARVLRGLGALDEVRRRAVRLEIGWEFRRWEDGTVLSSEDLAANCARLYGEETYTAHRADLLAAVGSRVPEETLRLGHRCVGLEDARGGALRLRFADGRSAEADVVIGADGVHSVVRATLFGKAPARDSGLCVFRSLVPVERAPDFARRPAQSLWLGPGHHFVHYPISGGDQVNLVAAAPTGDCATESCSATTTVEAFLAEFDGWDPRITGLIRAGGAPARRALLDRAPLTRWSEGCVTLLGDAAHPMFPFFGQGAAQALEDAAVVARLLAAHSGDPATALRRYEGTRIPRTTRLQTVSHGRAHINHLPDGPEQRARDAAYATQDPLVANGWIYGYDPDKDLKDLKDLKNLKEPKEPGVPKELGEGNRP